jgi:hypothetical protein
LFNAKGRLLLLLLLPYKSIATLPLECATATTKTARAATIGQRFWRDFASDDFISPKPAGVSHISFTV